jgi:GTP-binding protein
MSPRVKWSSTRFLKSAAEPQQFSDDSGREVAFAGRSNSGKSSALNAITERRNLARVSRTPGRTQLVNFFEIEDGRRLVDLPGYGYAAVPPAMRDAWRATLERYFAERASLAGLVLIVDSRRGLLQADLTMLEWVLERGCPAHVLLSKSDKLTRQAAATVLRRTRDTCAETPVSAQLFSARTRAGLDEVRTLLEHWLVT